MAPRMKRTGKGVTTGRSPTTRETSEKSGSPRTAPGRFRRTDRSKTKGKRTKHKLKLKGWLATPADWARFNAWAKINAQPKKIQKSESIVRPSKPLSQLKKKINILSQPRKLPDPSINCKLDHSISKAALEAVPSKRTILLALPNIRLVDFGRVYYKVSPAALKYEPSHRIIELSQPRLILPEECKPPRLSMCERRGFDEERLRKLALAKKLLDCPQRLTKEEIDELFTPRGIKRTALTYEITPWMNFLALPAYKSIKERKDENAVTWKKMIIEKGEKRGRNALAEYKKKEEEERRGKKRKCEETRRKKASGGGDTKKIIEQKEEEEEGEDESGDEGKKAKRRKIDKHAWRFAPHPCKDDPYRIKRAALEGKASSRMEELSKPRIHKNKVIRTNPFTVKKAALSASASGRVESLAKPSRPRSPVERKPAREKDKYGRPIFEMPVYGKVLPETKPYKMGECPSSEKKKVVKKRPIDPIVYQQTFDPCIYPDLAKRQRIERKRAEKLLSKKKGRRKKQKKKSRNSEYYEPKKVEDNKEEEGEGYEDKQNEQE